MTFLHIAGGVLDKRKRKLSGKDLNIHEVPKSAPKISAAKHIYAITIILEKIWLMEAKCFSLLVYLHLSLHFDALVTGMKNRNQSSTGLFKKTTLYIWEILQETCLYFSTWSILRFEVSELRASR